jgi:hypothetical protein
MVIVKDNFNLGFSTQFNHVLLLIYADLVRVCL